MDLTTRKLKAIEYIAGLKDENAFNNIEMAILESKARYGRKLKQLTEKQLSSRAEKSNVFDTRQDPAKTINIKTKPRR
jgi:hypothetical protein